MCFTWCYRSSLSSNLSLGSHTFLLKEFGDPFNTSFTGETRLILEFSWSNIVDVTHMILTSRHQVQISKLWWSSCEELLWLKLLSSNSSLSYFRFKFFCLSSILPPRFILMSMIQMKLCSFPQIIHFELPNTSEMFVHRSGRTGRAGKKGSAILIYSSEQSRDVKGIERQVGCKFAEVIC